VGACKVDVWVRVERVCKCTELEKKNERRTHRFKDPQNHQPPQATCVVCVCGFGGGARGRCSGGWHQEGVHRYLATARMLRLLGVRECAGRHAGCRGRGVGAGAHELGKKEQNHDLLVVVCVRCRRTGRWEVRSDGALMLETVTPARARPYWFCAAFHRN